MVENQESMGKLNEGTQPQGNNKNLVFGHKISGGDFVGLGFTNTLLGIVTLTLYRFWARTNVRKQIWRSVYMNDEAFEYTGTGGDLFRGFLIATAVITIPYLLVIFASQMLPPAIGGLLIFAVILFIYLIIGAAIWLAFRYLASRTVWRGIRFSIKGNPKEFSLMYFGQLLLTMVTFGWWSPKMAINVAEGLWGGMHYGDMPFSFHKERADDERLYGKFALGWVIAIVGYLLIIGSAMGSMASVTAGANSTNPEEIANSLAFISRLYAGIILYAVLVTLAFMPYRAAVMRAIAKCISLDGATFSLEIKWFDFLMLWFVNAIILVFSLGILAPVVQARTARFIISHLKSEGEVDLSKAEQSAAGPSQAEGLSDAFDIGVI